MQAYLLITAEKGAEQSVYNDLSDCSEVLSVNVLFGEWDLIARVEAENSEALSTFVLDKVRTIQGVSMSSTLIIAK